MRRKTRGGVLRIRINVCTHGLTVSALGACDGTVVVAPPKLKGVSPVHLGHILVGAWAWDYNYNRNWESTHP